MMPHIMIKGQTAQYKSRTVDRRPQTADRLVRLPLASSLLSLRHLGLLGAVCLRAFRDGHHNTSWRRRRVVGLGLL